MQRKPKPERKLIDLRSARHRMLGFGAVIFGLLALAGIVLDVWFSAQLESTLHAVARSDEPGALALSQALVATHQWVLAGKAAALIAAALAAAALAIMLDKEIGRLAESRARNRAVVDNMVDGAIHIDAQGHLVALNTAAERMFERTTADLRGKPLSVLLSQAHHEQLEARIREAAADTAPDRALNSALEVSGQRQNGTLFPLYLAISEVNMGQYPVFTAIARDLTETKQQIRALAEARDQAMAADRAKSQFLAVMSHEIRTPMNGILGMLDLLRDGTLTHQQQEFIDTAEKSSNVLLGIINDILDLSKIEAGKLDLQELDFDLGATVEEVATLVASHTKSEKVEVVSYVEPDVPQRVRGDPYRLRQVLTNLMGNAVKFTPEGEVIAHVRAEASTGDETRVRIEVRDTGIGIDPEVCKTLFQPFTQADASTTRRFGGTGLGLVIAKRLVEVMGGEIGVASSPGEGSTFWFTLRLARAQSAAVRADADMVGVKMLIVDDNSTNRVILEKYLSQWGAKTQSVDSAQAALITLRRASEQGAPFQLAILDMQMPEMDGIDLAQRIKGDASLEATHLLMLSSMGYPGAEARRVGIGVSLLKPVRQALLHDAVIKTLGVTAPSARDAAVLPRPPQRQFSARALVAEDNPVNQKVICMMLDRLGVNTEIVGNGALAVDVVKGEHRFDLVLMDVHMPVLNGLDATRKVRGHERENGLKPVPIIAMTASASKGDREACMEAGMDDFISKPVKRQSLEIALARWLSPRQASPMIARQTSTESTLR